MLSDLHVCVRVKQQGDLISDLHVCVRVKQQGAEQLSSMKAEQLRALDTLRAGYALEHSSSRVAELTNRLHTQEVLTH